MTHSLVNPRHSHEYDAPDDAGDRAMGRMLRVQAHRRECHMAGHRECEGVWVFCSADGEVIFHEPRRLMCSPERCSECKTDSMAAWDRRRVPLMKAASELLASAGYDPFSAPSEGSTVRMAQQWQAERDETRLAFMLLLLLD